jgi:hypothetical protein
MENLIFLFATSFMLRFANSRKFRNYLIGNTGCSVLLNSACRDFEKVTTKSGDNVYFTEFRENDVKYGIICVTLNDEYPQDKGQALLFNYINKLRKSFFVLHHTGLQDAIDWNNRSSLAYEDYWQDIDGKDWKIKAYTNTDIMAILYVKNINQLDVKQQELFLDSFYFNRQPERIGIAASSIQKNKV